jgi:hypothetical protein
MTNAYMVTGFNGGMTYAIDVFKTESEADFAAKELDGFVEPIDDYFWEPGDE